MKSVNVKITGLLEALRNVNDITGVAMGLESCSVSWDGTLFPAQVRKIVVFIEKRHIAVL